MMEKRLLLLLILVLGTLLISNRAQSQSLPAGTAAIVYTYDAVGNRTKVEYVVNNTASPLPLANVAKTDTAAVAQKLNEHALKVNALYPNPTTGQITVRLAAPLQNGCKFR